MSHYELNAILSDNISSIGTEYPVNEEYGRINNHHYKSGIKYLHFFKHKDDCKKVRFISDSKDVDFYIAEFNISITLLIQHMGYGKYGRQCYDGSVEKTIEFAIPTSKFKSKYIRSYVRDEINHRSLEEKKKLDNMLKKSKDIFKKSYLPKHQPEVKESENLTNEEITPEL